MDILLNTYWQWVGGIAAFMLFMLLFTDGIQDGIERLWVWIERLYEARRKKRSLYLKSNKGLAKTQLEVRRQGENQEYERQHK